MTIITQFKCDICGQLYHTDDDARACEAKGIPEPFPIGLLHCQKWGSKNRAAFAVAHVTVTGHNQRVAFWACRSWKTDSEGGDSLGDELCGSDLSHDPTEVTPEQLRWPETQRLIQWLKANGHTPRVWDKAEQAVVTLEVSP